MKRTEQLNELIAKLRAVVSLKNHDGWRVFDKEFLSPREIQAFNEWQTTQPEDTATIVQWQQAAKLVTDVRYWFKVKENECRVALQELDEIQSNPSEDYEIEKAS